MPTGRRTRIRPRVADLHAERVQLDAQFVANEPKIGDPFLLEDRSLAKAPRLQALPGSLDPARDGFVHRTAN